MTDGTSEAMEQLDQLRQVWVALEMDRRSAGDPVSAIEIQHVQKSIEALGRWFSGVWGIGKAK